MKLRAWQIAGVVAALSATGLAVGLDRAVKAEDSALDLAPEGEGRALALAQEGFFHWSRSLFLVCPSDGSSHLVAKVRLAERNRLTSGSTEASTIFISDETRRQDFPRNILLALDTRMSLVSGSWRETLTSGDLTTETLMRISEAMPSADAISIEAMERGAYFGVTSSPSDTQSFIRDCVSDEVAQ